MQPETDKQPAPPITYRKGRPAWNVKRYEDQTAEECAQVFAEYGERPADALARPGTNTGDALPWGLEWIEALADCNPVAHAEAIGDAARDGFDFAREQARELFGARAQVYSDGRSGGWLVLHHPTITRDEIEAARATIEDAEACEIAGREIMPDGRTREEHRQEAEGEAVGPVTADELVSANDLLARLEEFGRYVASALADHGHAQAYALFQLFEYYAQEYADEQAEANAAARLARARTAFEDAASRLRDAARSSVCIDGCGPSDVYAAVEAFDAARLELERAKGLARCPDCTPLPDGSSECSDCGELPAPKGGAA